MSCDMAFILIKTLKQALEYQKQKLKILTD